MKTKILIVLLFLLGVGVFIYPAVSNYLAERNQAKVIESYSDDVSRMAEAQMEKELKRAEKYNRQLQSTIIIDPFTEKISEDLNQKYLDILNVNDTMGQLMIPKIEVELPIYHGTSDAVLQKGAGHIQNTSLPVGGESTHAVVSGHRGLPSAKLFTDLDKLEVGDEFYIQVLNRKLAYRVDQIRVVEPTQTEDLQIVEGKDYVTLLTCTPYSVNSHRLLVRGERTEYVETESVQEEEKQEKTEEVRQIKWWEVLMLSCVLVLVLLFVILLMRGRRRK